jgi:exosome complex RNA-binding protein Rrp42 (RNase PH superfamily)
VVPTANGSCRLESKAYDIIVAIKCEIGRPTKEKPDEGIVNISVEFGGSVLPRLQDFTGRQAIIEADTLGDIVSEHISSMCISALNKKRLCIREGRACWISNIDILIERVDGPIMDPVSIGIRGAFMDLQLPHVALEQTEEEDNEESTVPIVDLMDGMWKIDPADSPALCITLGLFGNNEVVMVDLDRIEENLAKQKENCLMTFAINSHGACSGLHKFGAGSFDPAHMEEIISAAQDLGKKLGALFQTLSARVVN